MRQKWWKMEISVVFGSAEGHFWPKFKKFLFFIKYGYKLNYIGGHPDDWMIWPKIMAVSPTSTKILPLNHFPDFRDGANKKLWRALQPSIFELESSNKDQIVAIEKG